MISCWTLSDSPTAETSPPSGRRRFFTPSSRQSTPSPTVTVELVAPLLDGVYRLLFVIDHQIAEVPGAYRIRPLNLETGLLETIVGPTKVPLQDDMNGIGRRQVWSPDGRRLYTLYIRQTHHHHADGADHAHGAPGTDGFVHVLDLDEEWAFCLDLPPSFGRGDLATTALAASPDGDTIAIADANAGEVVFA